MLSISLFQEKNKQRGVEGNNQQALVIKSLTKLKPFVPSMQYIEGE
jgi:hypothetical protein